MMSAKHFEIAIEQEPDDIQRIDMVFGSYEQAKEWAKHEEPSKRRYIFEVYSAVVATIEPCRDSST